MEDCGCFHRLPGNVEVRKNLFRIALVAFTALIAVVTPHFGLFVNLIGSVACAALAFVLPIMFHARLHSSSMSQRDKVLAGSIIAFGIVGGGISFAMTVAEFIALGSESETQGEVANATNTSHLAANLLFKTAVTFISGSD